MSDEGRDGVRTKWAFHPLGELVGKISSGGTPEAGNPRYYSPKGIPFVKIDDLTATQGRAITKTGQHLTSAAIRESSAKLFPKGTILISMYGTIGLVKQLGRPAATNQAIAALLEPFACDSSFLVHAIDFRRRDLEGSASQTTQPNVSATIIRAFGIHVPESLSEQRRIAEVLDTADEAIRQTEALMAKLKQMKQGLLHDLLTRGLDENGELRDPVAQPEEFNESPLGRIPRGWDVRPLAQIIVEMCNGTTAPQQGKPTPYPISRIETISDGRINYDRVKFISRPEPRYALQAGDILYSHINSVAHMGKVAFYAGERVLYHGMNLMLVRPDISKVVPEYLFEVLASERARAYARRECKPAVNQASLGQAQIGRLSVAVPGREEQQRIMSAISCHAARIQAEEAYRDKLQLLKKGLMQDLLTGRVRVPAPNTEPELLEIGQ